MNTHFDIFQFLFLDIRLFLGCHITNLQRESQRETWLENIHGFGQST